MVLSKRMGAECLGTFWLVLGGCGSALLAVHTGGAGNAAGLGLLGVSLAFGLALLTGICAFGPISGGHFNPAVTLGLWAGGRFDARDVLPYWLAQVVGGLLAGGLLAYFVDLPQPLAWLTGSGGPQQALSPMQAGAFASNGYGTWSPDGYPMGTAFLCEALMTAMFVIIIMGATHWSAPAAMAPVSIGLTLTLIHIVSIPITNTSVNPARSTGVALFAGSAAVQQLWLFWLAPLTGALGGGLLYRWLEER